MRAGALLCAVCNNPCSLVLSNRWQSQGSWLFPFTFTVQPELSLQQAAKGSQATLHDTGVPGAMLAFPIICTCSAHFDPTWNECPAGTTLNKVLHLYKQGRG